MQSPSAFVRRLCSIAELSEAEVRALEELPMVVRQLAAKQDIFKQGARPTHSCLVLSGLAVRYKVSVEGKRQILGLYPAGDIPDLHSLHLTVLDDNLAALTPCVIGLIPHQALHEANARYPALAGALWRKTLIDASITREWLFGVGRRDGLARTAHFLCELYTRLETVGLAADHAFEMTMTQADLADALGMSPVHMNRTLQELKARRLLQVRGRTFHFPSWPALVEAGQFDLCYLHIAPKDRSAPP